MDSEKLIDLVKAQKGLYDLSSPNYSDSTWKENVWKEIAEELHQTDVACKSRWNNLRDMYRKSLKRNKIISGQETKIIKKYKYEDQLKFLKDFLQERDTITNISCNFSLSSEDDKTEQDTPVIINNENTQLNKKNHEDIWTRPKNIKKPKNVPEKFQEMETSSSTKMKYLLEKKETESKTECHINSIDVFLLSISATLNTLDPYNLNLAKSRIFNVVQEIEMNQILNKQPDNFFNNTSSSLRAINPLMGEQNLYDKQSTSVSMGSSYTEYSHSPSPQMIQPLQDETPLHTLTSITNQN